MTRVLVTGSSGAVGRPVCRELVRRGHQVRGLDRVPAPGIDDQVIGDIADASTVREAMRDVRAVIHLAAQPVDAEFSLLVGPNVIGLQQVMSAAREAAVRRVVLASSIQVLGRRPPGSGPARVDEAGPSNHYGLTKRWAEQMGEMYARCHGMSVIAVRIGWLVRNLAEAERMRQLDLPDIYLSHRDAGRLFASAVEAEVAGFAVVYGASRGAERVYDMEPTRRLLGYEALDRWPEGLDFPLP